MTFRVMQLHNGAVEFESQGGAGTTFHLRFPLLQQEAAHRRQQMEIAKLQKFVDRFRAKASKARQAQSRVKALERMGHPVVPKRSDPGTLYFSRPVAIRVTKKGLEAGLDPFHDAAAAGI